MNIGRKGMGLWTALLVLVFAVAVPSVSFAQGRGRRHSDVFVNGHDARDGRYDGRGPRANRHDRDNDNDDDDQYRNNGNYRRNGSYGNYGTYGNNGGYRNGGYNNVYQYAMQNGYQAGLNTGASDAQRGQSYDPQRSHYYRNATDGYNSSYGNRGGYQQAYRDGFLRGYDQGYRQYGGYNNGGYNYPRSRTGSILGTILGRP